MPRSSFFSGLDQVSEEPKKINRSSLQDSPYLSSPIRPFPSYNVRQSSNTSVSSKRSRKQCGSKIMCDRTSSPAQSTLGSLRLASPYSESIFSIHSLCTASTQNGESERQSLSRTVLLPNEIDALAKALKLQRSRNQQDYSPKDEENCNQYDLSDFDDDSTIASDFAKSVTDENVFNKIMVEGDDGLLYSRKESLPVEVEITEQTEMKKSEVLDTSSLKLPSIYTDEAVPAVGGSQKSISKSTIDKSIRKLRNKEKISTGPIVKKSPYAANLNRSKQGTLRKKN